MPTLVSTLRPHSVSREEIAYRYPGPTGLVSRILGAVSYTHLTLPTIYSV